MPQSYYGPGVPPVFQSLYQNPMVRAYIQNLYQVRPEADVPRFGQLPGILDQRGAALPGISEQTLRRGLLSPIADIIDARKRFAPTEGAGMAGLLGGGRPTMVMGRGTMDLVNRAPNVTVMPGVQRSLMNERGRPTPQAYADMSDLQKYKGALLEQEFSKRLDALLPPEMRGAKMPDRATAEAEKAAALKKEAEIVYLNYLRDLLKPK